MKLKRQLFVLLWSVGAERVSKTPIKLVYPVEACLTHPNRWMIGRSKELEDVDRVASSFPTNLGKIKATLLAGYKLRDIVPKRSDQVPVSAVAGIKQSVKDDERWQFRVFFSNLQ